jgi:WD40 repeat protein
MYELQTSFSKGVNHLNRLGREITYVGNDHVTFLSGTCGVIEHIQSGHQRLIVPSQPNGIIESVLVSSTTSISFVERDENNIYITTLDPTSTERKSSFAIQSEREKYMHSFVSTMYEEEIIFIGLLVPHQNDDDNTLTLSLYKMNGEILAQTIIDCNLNALQPDMHQFQMSITSFDKSIVCIQSHLQYWFFRYYYCQKSNIWEWKLLNRPTFSTATTAGDHSPMLHNGELMISHTSLKVLDHNMTVFATNCKRLIITESGIIQTIHDTNDKISCLDSIHDLLLVGCLENVTILVFSISSMTNDLILQRKIKLASTDIQSYGVLRSLAISPDGTNGCVTIHPKVLSESFDVASSIATFHPLEEFELKLHSRFIFEHASKEKVIMSTSIQNELIASVGRQSLVLLDMQGGEICCRKMDEPPIWVCLHPSGLHILIAFEHEVRCEHILIGEFKLFWRKSGKNTRMCKFSDDGEKFGVIQDGSVLVFDFITGDLIQDLKHSSQVLNFIWLQDETSIISQNENGILYRWNTFTGDKESECMKFKEVSDMEYVTIKTELLWLKRGNLLQELHNVSFEISKTIMELDSTTQITFMMTSKNHSKFCVIVLEDKISTSISSYVRVYNIEKGNFSQIKLMGRVSGMVISSDDKKIYAFLSSGVFVSFNIIFRDEMLVQESSEYDSPDRQRRRENVLVSDSYLQEKEAIIVEYEAMLNEELNKHTYRMELTSLRNKEEIARLTEQLSDMSNMYISMLDQLQVDQQNEEEKCRSDLETQQRLYQNELEQLEVSFKSKIEKVKQQLKTKEREWNMQLKEKEIKISELKSSQVTELESIQNELKSELDEWKQKMESIKKEIQELSFENKETLSQTEYEIDRQVESSKSTWLSQHTKARENTLKSSSDNAILIKKTKALSKSIDERKDMIRMTLQRQGELEKQKTHLENSLKEVEKEYQSQLQDDNTKSEDIQSLQKRENYLLKQNQSSLQKMEDLKNQTSNFDDIEKLQMDIEGKKKKVIEIQKEIITIEEGMKSIHQDSTIAHQELKKKRETYSIKNSQYNRILGMVQECLSTDLRSAVKKLEVLLAKDVDVIQQSDTFQQGKEMMDENGAKDTSATTTNDDDDNEKEMLLKELQSLKKRCAFEKTKNQEAAKIRLQENQELLDKISKCLSDQQKNQSIK